jgi:DNA adenine methylase
MNTASTIADHSSELVRLEYVFGRAVAAAIANGTTRLTADDIERLNRAPQAMAFDVLEHAIDGEDPRVHMDSLPPEPKPFVKWVGGKRQLMNQLRPLVPGHFTNYFEPFLGGGALFFELRLSPAILSDANERLVRAYIGVRDDIDTVIDLLRTYRNDKAFFLEMRNREIDTCSDAEVAAWLIYLSKTGFNGLYRVNQSNRFNVPFGDNARATICDEHNLRGCSAALQDAIVMHEDFEQVLDLASAGDFVYADPPYVPLTATSLFTSYTAEGFGSKEQRRLRDAALRAKCRGVHVLMSNSSAGLVRELYQDDFEIIEVDARRNVNCKADGRGTVKELIIR